MSLDLSHLSVPVVCAIGTGIGLLHALSGPDHLAALIPLSVSLPKLRSFELGIAWGAGHGLGVGVLAVLIFAIKDITKIQFLDKYMDLAVGVTIIIIGFVAIYEAKSYSKLHHHNHSVECSHACDHEHAVEKDVEHIGECPKESDALCEEESDECDTRSTSAGEPCCAASQALAEAASSGRGQASLIWLTLTTGVIHGLSGCGHIFGILPALALHRWQLFCGYIVTFCIGCCIGMGAFCVLISAASKSLVQRFQRPELPSDLAFWCGVVAVIFGIVWVTVVLLWHG
ncbi:hypothetical protein FOL47_006448 [Perkinsus chesapeaki]|uniref:Uncharacterized protein n=1 Tax=Perkinsus chesapeaki TaxID=330153 RepID=A0A7J6MXE5_PERCH|nr:hypothetical protein FOL47_006448 [Perkinsus chesapeaki]